MQYNFCEFTYYYYIDNNCSKLTNIYAFIGSRYAMMSMKTATAALLKQYRILPATACDAKLNSFEKEEPLRVKFDIMMKAVDNFTVQLQRRSK